MKAIFSHLQKIIKEKVISEEKTENSFMIPLRFEYVCSFFIGGIFNISLFLNMRGLFLS